LARKHFGALFSLRKFWRANILARFSKLASFGAQTIPQLFTTSLSQPLLA
jgi:hypothetical protein